MNNAKRIGSLAFAIIFFVLEFNLVGIVILVGLIIEWVNEIACLLYTSPSPRDKRQSRMPSSA